MTDERVAVLLGDLYPLEAAGQPDWADVLCRAEVPAVAATEDRAGAPRRPRLRRSGARNLVLVAALVGAVGVASAAVVALRPPIQLQKAKS